MRITTESSHHYRKRLIQEKLDLKSNRDNKSTHTILSSSVFPGRSNGQHPSQPMGKSCPVPDLSEGPSIDQSIS